MTDTTAPVAEAKHEPVQNFQDDLQRLSFEQLSTLINQRNSLVAEINAASGDRIDLAEELTENSTDPEIVRLREARDEAIMALHEHITPLVEQKIAAGSEGLAETEAKVAEIDKQTKPGLTFYKTVYGEDEFSFFPKQTKVKGSRVSGVGTGGGRRIRGFNFKVNANGAIEEFENAAGVARWLDEDTVKIQEAFFQAAGNPKQVKDAPDEIQFTVDFTEVDEDNNVSNLTANITAYRPEKETPADPKPVDAPVATEAPVDDEPDFDFGDDEL